MEIVKSAYKVRQIYTSCLAQASYVISSRSAAAIIDPIRDTDQYKQILQEEKLTLKYVIETHFHADFVSGYLDLQKFSPSCEIVFGPGANPSFKFRSVKHDELLHLGDIQLQVLHTPGHTPESTCFVLVDENKAQKAVFTGDTLFVGDVGRPDLLEALDITQDQLAKLLFKSIHEVLGKLPDDCIVYPGHGPGSPCGKKISKETTSTIGKEKETNYAFQMTNEQDFVTAVLTGLTPPPGYFLKNALMNRAGPEILEDLLKKSLRALTLSQFEAEVKKGAMIIDVRSIDDYNRGFIPNSMHYSLEGMLAIFIGTMVPDLNQPMVLIAPPGREKEAIVRLNRVGYGGTVGYLTGGFETYVKAKKPISNIKSVSSGEFIKKLSGLKLNEPNAVVLDVRKPQELETFAIEGSRNLPLQSMNEKIGELSDLKDKKIYVMCAAGYRASIATSLLKAHSFNDVVFIEGGVAKIRESMAAAKI